jgi:hypothetical protein
MPLISRDEIKEGYVNTFGLPHDELPPESNRVATETFFDTILLLLARQVSVIAEAAFQHPLWKDRMDALTGAAKVCIVICSLDSDTAARRHLDRGLNDPRRTFYHGDNRVTVYREQGVLLPPAAYDPPAFALPTIEVWTRDGYSPTLNSIRDFIARAPSDSS